MAMVQSYGSFKYVPFLSLQFPVFRRTISKTLSAVNENTKVNMWENEYSTLNHKIIVSVLKRSLLTLYQFCVLE